MNSHGFHIPVALILCAAIATAAPDLVSAQVGRQKKQPVIKQPRSRRGQKELPQLPELNKKILAFCETNAGKQVGSGECAALAEQALREAGAKPHHELTAPLADMSEEDYVWGQLLQPTDPVLPGDVLQFRNVELKFSPQPVCVLYGSHNARRIRGSTTQVLDWATLGGKNRRCCAACYAAKVTAIIM